jgi:hypothetical protein
MKMLITLLVLIAAIGHARADTLTFRKDAIDLEMKKGQFRYSDSGNYAEQMLTVVNHSNVTVKYITVECGFFHGDLLIGKNDRLISNLLPDQSGYAEVSVRVLSVDRTDCRFEGASQ